MRYHFVTPALLLASFAAAASAQQSGGGALGAPVVTCFGSTENTITLQVCGDATTGAPAGFSVQWMSCDDFAANNNTWYASDDPRLCKASFSGMANETRWNLGPGLCETIVIGGLNDADPGVSFTCNDPLDCDGCYVFRAFAHAGAKKKRSAFTANVTCTTMACVPTSFVDGDHCTKSQGYFGSGNDSRDAMVACFGGFGGTDTTPVTANAGSLLTIGGTNSYEWHLTQTYTDVQGGPNFYWLDNGLIALRTAMGGGGTSGCFSGNGSNTTSMGSGGGLASQTAALSLNLAVAGFGQCADSGCTDGSAGSYGAAILCNFEEGDTFKNDGTPISQATADALNGQTVADVLAAANAYLGSCGTLPYALSSAADLNELVANLNLAFDLKDWDGDEIDDCACGGMTAFAESHLCRP